MQWTNLFLGLLLGACVPSKESRPLVVTGYHLIGDDSISLNESLESLRIKFGDFGCTHPEDVCSIQDTVYLDGKPTPIFLIVSKSGKKFNEIRTDIVVNDTLCFSKFRAWKKWHWSYGWYRYYEGDYEISYRFRKEKDSILKFMFSANLRYIERN